MSLVIEVLFEVLRRFLKGSVLGSLILFAGIEIAPANAQVKRTPLQHCIAMQGASLLDDYDSCYEVLDNAGLLDISKDDCKQRLSIYSEWAGPGQKEYCEKELNNE